MMNDIVDPDEETEEAMMLRIEAEERSTSRRLAVFKFAPRLHRDWQAPNSETPARAWSQKVGGDTRRPGLGL